MLASFTFRWKWYGAAVRAAQLYMHRNEYGDAMTLTYRNSTFRLFLSIRSSTARQWKLGKHFNRPDIWSTRWRKCIFPIKMCMSHTEKRVRGRKWWDRGASRYVYVCIWIEFIRIYSWLSSFMSFTSSMVVVAIKTGLKNATSFHITVMHICMHLSFQCCGI